MRVNREKAKAAFENYVQMYDAKDEKVKLKIEHTFRVSELCAEIARESGFTKEEIDIAWLLGLLHDVGRFEQLKQYGTFIDAESIDHAQLGADILFVQNKITDYIDDLSENDLLEKAVRLHSAYRLPDDFTQRELKFSHVLRDADKIDILRVNVEVPLEEIYNVTTKELKECHITDEVMSEFMNEHTILRSLKKAPVDHIVGHISLVYELVYPISMVIVSKQGYLQKIMTFHSCYSETNEQFKRIRGKMYQYLYEKTGVFYHENADNDILSRMQSIIKECGNIVLYADRTNTLVQQKEGHANFVTIYDKKIQDYLKLKLIELIPDAIFMGEEDEEHDFCHKGYVFIVDPIDGTTNFMKDYHTSAISIGLLKDGQPYIGLIYNPYLDELFIAQKGCGAYLNGKEIHVSHNPLSDGIVLFGTSPYYEDLAKKSFDKAYEYFTEALDVRRSGSAALDLCSIAAGRAELYFEYKLSPWDYAAGCLIVEEAGGIVTQMDGTALIFDRACSVLATNAIIK